MGDAVALSGPTQSWLETRRTSRAQLAQGLNDHSLDSVDLWPYRTSEGDTQGFPDSQTVIQELVDAVKGAGDDPGTLTVEKEISLGQQVAILESFKRDLTWRRSRKFHLLATLAAHLQDDAQIQAAQVANIGAVSSRRRVRFNG